MATQSYRDSQRSKFYNWMRKFSNEHNGISRIENYDLNSVISLHVQSYGHKAPTFVHKGSSYSMKSGVVTVPLYDSMTPQHVCILVGWCVMWNRRGKLVEGWHGPTFCRVWAETFSKITGIPEADIVKSMRDSKLKVIGATSTPGPRIIKKEAALAARVSELDAAIKRGREEFEEFLKPIKDELARVRVELELTRKKIQS